MGSVVLYCSETVNGSALPRNGCPGALTGIHQKSVRGGGSCVSAQFTHKCLIILKNTQLECNCDANIRSWMNLVMKQNP